MPTSRPRHTITETDEIAGALDEAARRWPHEQHAGGRQGAQAADARREAIARTSGALTGDHGEGYLADLRSEWPE